MTEPLVDARPRDAIAIIPVTEAALDEFMTMLVGPDWRDAPEEVIGGRVVDMERDAHAFFASDLPALLAWNPDDAELRRIRAEVLWVGGDQSPPMFGEMRDRLRRLVPHYSELTVRGAGHQLASTHPAVLASALAAHFTE